MREIIFRAWQEYYKEMLSHKRIEYGAAVELHNLDKGVVLMQYTGIKDKNGVEIYEGDIVKHEIRSDLKNSVVSFERGAWFVSDEGNENELAHFECDRFIKVIGNIYENPELIKEGKE